MKIVKPPNYWGLFLDKINFITFDKTLCMNHTQRKEIIDRAKAFFKAEIVHKHINNACHKASQLNEYNVNPFLLSYLANFLKGDNKPRSMAEALVYPRLLGSSINTSFGMGIQKLISSVFEGFGSTTQGIDIEFIDQLDGRKKYCQLKSGPNTINHDDVETIINHFNSIKNLARTNNLNISLTDLIVGVIYGEKNELSSHYNRIDKSYPVFIGTEFWHRVTGQEDFYLELIHAFGAVALEIDGRDQLKKTIDKLTLEIQKKYKF